MVSREDATPGAPGVRDDDMRGIWRQAAYWYAEVSQSKPDKATLAAFASWIEADPRHIDAMHAIGRKLGATGQAYRARPIWARPMLRRKLYRSVTPAAPVVRWGARIGGLSAAAAVGYLWLGVPAPVVYQTGVGEVRQFELPDSSKITLSGGTRVTVQIGVLSRRLALESGEALFTVAKDRYRPFRVVAGDRVVQAVGTEFDVAWAEKTINVAVSQGTVIVAPRGEDSPSFRPGTPAPDAAVLTAGYAVAYAAQQPLPGARKVDPALVAAWRRGSMRFDHVSFTSVLDTLGRFFPGTYKTDDQVLGAETVNLLLPAGDRAQALQMLEDALRVRAITTAPDTVVFRRAAAGAGIGATTGSARRP